MMRNLAIKFEKGFVTAKKIMSSNQALLGRSSGSDSTSKLSLEDREDNDSLRHQFNLIKSPTEKESFGRFIRPPWVHNVLNLVKQFFLLESVLHRGHFFEIVSNNYDWEKKEDVAITDENPLKQDTDFSF